MDVMQTLQDQGVLDVDGTRLDYRMIGPRPAEAPTLVLLHEGPVAIRDDVPDRLAAATKLGVFACSPAGGQSSLEDMTQAARHTLPRVLAAIGFRRGLLAGQGDGASIATLYVGGNQDHRVRGLVLLAPRNPAFQSWEITDALAYIRVPILIVQGERDPHARRYIEVTREECYCPVEAMVLPGHSPQREAADETLGAIADFTDRIMRVHAEAAAA
jgi:pimeloyl-ACP methyl ester carboxylesterase